MFTYGQAHHNLSHVTSRGDGHCQVMPPCPEIIHEEELLRVILQESKKMII